MFVRLKSIGWIISLFFVLILPSFAENATHDNTQAIIWQIQKGKQPTSYLLGTLHLGKTNSRLPDDFAYALQQSEQLVLENEAVDEAFAQKQPEQMQQLAMIQLQQASLNDTLGKKIVPQIAQIFRQSAMTEIAQMFDRPDIPYNLAPWAIWLYLGYTNTPVGYDLQHGMDLLLLRQAKIQHKPLLGLELFEPYYMMRTLPDDVAIRNIHYMLAHLPKLRQHQAQTIQAYEKRDAARLWQQSHGDAMLVGVEPRDAAIVRALIERLVSERNRNWLPTIQRIIADKPTLIAVGAAHLYGEHGLVALLRQAGYRVEPFVWRGK